MERARQPRAIRPQIVHSCNCRLVTRTYEFHPNDSLGGLISGVRHAR